MERSIEHIEEGMTVYDADENSIGEIDFIRFGDEDPYRPGTQVVSDPQEDLPRSLFEQLVHGFVGSEEMPSEIEARLHRYGYIRIHHTGPFEAAYYTTLNNVARVMPNEGRVYLSVNKDSLIEAEWT